MKIFEFDVETVRARTWIIGSLPCGSQSHVDIDKIQSHLIQRVIPGPSVIPLDMSFIFVRSFIHNCGVCDSFCVFILLLSGLGPICHIPAGHTVHNNTIYNIQHHDPHRPFSEKITGSPCCCRLGRPNCVPFARSLSLRTSRPCSCHSFVRCWSHEKGIDGGN